MKRLFGIVFIFSLILIFPQKSLGCDGDHYWWCGDSMYYQMKEDFCRNCGGTDMVQVTNCDDPNDSRVWAYELECGMPEPE